MQRGGRKHSAAHSAHPHVDLGRVALGAVIVHGRGGVLRQDPSLQVVSNDLHLNGVQLNEIVMTYWARVALAPVLHLEPQAILHVHQHAPYHVPRTVRDLWHRLHDPRYGAVVATDGATQSRRIKAKLVHVALGDSNERIALVQHLEVASCCLPSGSAGRRGGTVCCLCHMLDTLCVALLGAELGSSESLLSRLASARAALFSLCCDLVSRHPSLQVFGTHHTSMRTDSDKRFSALYRAHKLL